MTQKHHYTGLTDAEVIANRKKYGTNILTPPEKETMWDKLKRACSHWISVSMGIIFTATTIAAAMLTASMGAVIWVMPLIMAVATLLILIVGLFGGFKDPLFRILITAFVLSMGISIYEYEWAGMGFTTFFEPIGIVVALLLATGVAFFLERSNEKTFQSLNEVNDDTPVKVIRNNNVCQVARKEIVVGDIVLLEAGEEVPADCKLLECLNLTLNESSLTGEPECSKTTDPERFDAEATYPSDEIMKGSIVIEGYCTARVTKVGDATECGKVFEAAQVNEGDPTPLSDKLNRLADLITKTSYAIAALVIAGRIAVYFIYGEGDFSNANGWIDFVSFFLQTVMIAVTLIVVAVPEGLPMSVTLSLAFSMRKLMKENTLPRTMHSCETMGAASVICTDKTGTLTQNRMQVADTMLCETDEALIAELIAANTTANLDFSAADKINAIGNPTECALLLWLHDKGVNYQPVRESAEITDRLPFTTENKYMATVALSAVTGRRMVMVKGAPEIILAISSIEADKKAEFESQLKTYQDKAMRTLAIAYAEIGDSDKPFADGQLALSNLHFAGIFAISDPVRPEVPDAIKSCISAGIQVKIVTGDTPGTAKEIGRQIGLWTDSDCDDNILTGAEFDAMTDEELAERVQRMKIMSRARPNDKERLVRLLKRQGMVVAVTGDGTNDAPALNAADVGLSMGDGTAVAKEASDMTIQDSSFSTITNAVMWGRSLYKNIQRFIMYQMTINVVACLIVLIGAFIGAESPLTVTQMLWVNLIMDTFAAIALASLPPSHSVMNEQPRRVTDSIINHGMAVNVVGVGGFFTLLLLVILVAMQHSDITCMADLLHFHFGAYNGLSAYELSLFFTLFVMLQFWNMFNAKAFMTGGTAFSHLKECRGFMTIAFVIFVGQFVIVELGGQMFNVTPLKAVDWIVIILSTSFVLWVGEAYRWIRRR
jgi:Ca2+-transporting ATPase